MGVGHLLWYVLVHYLVNVALDSHPVSLHRAFIWVCTQAFSLEACETLMDFVPVSLAILVGLPWGLLDICLDVQVNNNYVMITQSRSN